jgi:MFS family permease
MQTPAGALVDASRAKRMLVAAAAVFVALVSFALPFLPAFWPVALSQATAHAATAVFGPALAAITLGIVGRAGFAARIGRNESFNHLGNAFAATAAGAGAWFWGPGVVFFVLAAMALASLVSVLTIPERAIDHARARELPQAVDRAVDRVVDRMADKVDDKVVDKGADDGGEGPRGLAVLLTCRPLLIFAACAVLFHFANAAMLPLVGQKLSLQNNHLGTTLMSVCIIAAQVVMVPMAMLVGARADAWGRKPLFLAGFLILPIRGALYTLSDDPYWLVGVQLLDGIGAGLYGALFPIIVADLMRGTGRFNVAQGAVMTAQGIGAALSTALAGFIVVHAGYGAAFLTLGGLAALGAVLFAVAMPETGDRASAAEPAAGGALAKAG